MQIFRKNMKNSKVLYSLLVYFTSFTACSDIKKMHSRQDNCSNLPILGSLQFMVMSLVKVMSLIKNVNKILSKTNYYIFLSYP